MQFMKFQKNKNFSYRLLIIHKTEEQSGQVHFNSLYPSLMRDLSTLRARCKLHFSATIFLMHLCTSCPEGFLYNRKSDGISYYTRKGCLEIDSSKHPLQIE